MKKMANAEGALPDTAISVVVAGNSTDSEANNAETAADIHTDHTGGHAVENRRETLSEVTLVPRDVNPDHTGSHAVENSRETLSEVTSVPSNEAEKSVKNNSYLRETTATKITTESGDTVNPSFSNGNHEIDGSENSYSINPDSDITVAQEIKAAGPLKDDNCINSLGGTLNENGGYSTRNTMDAVSMARYSGTADIDPSVSPERYNQSISDGSGQKQGHFSEPLTQLSPLDTQDKTRNVVDDCVKTVEQSQLKSISPVCEVINTPMENTNLGETEVAVTELGHIPEFETVVIKIEDTDEGYNMAQDRLGTGSEKMEYRESIITDLGSSEDSDSDSESSSDESSSSDTDKNEMGGSETVKVITEIKEDPPDFGDDELEDNRKMKQSNFGLEELRTKGELFPEELPKIEDLQITVDNSVQLTHMGNVASIVGVLVVVEGNRELPPLNEDTVLFFENRHAIGMVFEVFGPVLSPWYSIRFNSVSDIEDRDICVGMPVYCAPKVDDLTRYVFVDSLRKMKGTDASWENNNEPPVWSQEFSDDEEERRAKAKKRGKITTPGEDENDKGPKQPNKRKQNMGQRNNNTPGQQGLGGGRFPHGGPQQGGPVQRQQQFPPRHSFQRPQANSFQKDGSQIHPPRPPFQSFPPRNQGQQFLRQPAYANPRQPSGQRQPPPRPAQFTEHQSPIGSTPAAPSPPIFPDYQTLTGPRPRVQLRGSQVWPPRFEPSHQFGFQQRPLPPQNNFRNNSPDSFCPQIPSQPNTSMMSFSGPPPPPSTTGRQPLQPASLQYVSPPPPPLQRPPPIIDPRLVQNSQNQFPIGQGNNYQMPVISSPSPVFGGQPHFTGNLSQNGRNQFPIGQGNNPQMPVISSPSPVFGGQPHFTGNPSQNGQNQFPLGLGNNPQMPVISSPSPVFGGRPHTTGNLNQGFMAQNSFQGPRF